MNIRFRGTRGSLPSAGPKTVRYGGNTSCVEVRSGDTLLILDSGSGIRALGADLVKDADEGGIDAALLISHTHWDHIQGLPFFAPAYSPHNHIRVFAPPGRGLATEQALRAQMDPLHFPVRLDALVGLTKIEELQPNETKIGNFTVRTIELNHPGGCAGFRIEAGGASFAYLSDHEPETDVARRDALVRFIRDVDLLIVDTQYTQTEYEQRVGWGHGSLPASVALALDGKVARLMFFHHDPSHSDRDIDEMIATARKQIAGAALPVEAAAEDETIMLSPRAHAPRELARLDSNQE